MHFQLEKGGKFALDKGILRVKAGMGWDAGDGVDLDASAFGLVHLPGGKAMMYGDGSHAVFYGNTDLKQPNGSFLTKDGSILHSGDNRTGEGDGDDEIITFDFGKLPTDIVEIAIWVTIYHAHKSKPTMTFGAVKNPYIKLTDVEAGGVLCEYKLGTEFATATAVQVGSFVRTDAGTWDFAAVGSGAEVEIDKIIEQYS